MAGKRSRDAAATPTERGGSPVLPRFCVPNGSVEDDDDAEVDPSLAYSSLLASLKSVPAKRQKERNIGEQRKSESGAAKSEKIQSVQLEDDESEEEGDAPTENEENDQTSVPEELSDDEKQTNTPDEFKLHLDHVLTSEEIAKLDSGKVKFNLDTTAFGMQKAKWLSAEKFPNAESKLVNCNVKLRLRKSWENVVKKKFGDFRSELQCQFFALCNSYRDVLHSRKASLVGKKGSVEVMDAYLLHIINHTLKTKYLVTKNNEKLHQNAAQSAAVLDVPRDQGFTRPKVLILLPMRSTALKLVKRLIDLLPPLQKVTVEFKQRFFDDFGVESDDKEENSSKPSDHQQLFSGNNDDHFRIGIKFKRKSVHLYSDFLTSDIIVASPLGLMTSIGEAETDNQKNVDYLSSIEILIIDFADVILMQNWSHVSSIFEHLNKIPSQQHDTDIMRIREWYLNGHARYFRQTIFLSSYPDAAINALYLRSCVNHSGKVKLHCRYDGVLSTVVLQVRQVYEGLQCDSLTTVDDARFEFFVKQIYPKMKESVEGGTLLFVRSYFDFVRLRNFLKAENASFCLLGEYTKTSDISRSRTWFYHGERRIMLYTERAHFYHRYKIRGIRDLIFYSLPDHANFYSEMTNMLEGTQNPSCTVIYSKFDNMQLERIVGSSRTQKLLASKDTMMFL